MDADRDATFLTQAGEKAQDFPVIERLPLDEISDGDDSDEIRYTHRQRQLETINKELEAKRQEYEKRMEKVKQGELDFQRKQRVMIENIRKFKSFIVGTDKKRLRAQRKADEEKKEYERKQQRIKQLNNDLRAALKSRDSLALQHARTQPHEKYLRDVLTVSEQFSDVEELVSRYEVLSNANEDLRLRAASVNNEMTVTQTDIQQLYKDKQNEILIKNSQLAKLQQDLETLTNRISHQENTALRMESKAHDTISRFGLVQRAIKNLYHRVQLSRQLSGKRTHDIRMDDFETRDKTKKKDEQTNRIRYWKLLEYMKALLGDVGDRMLELQDIVAMKDEREDSPTASPTFDEMEYVEYLPPESPPSPQNHTSSARSHRTMKKHRFRPSPPTRKHSTLPTSQQQSTQTQQQQPQQASGAQHTASTDLELLLKSMPDQQALTARRSKIAEIRARRKKRK